MDYDLKRPLNALFSAGNQFGKYADVSSELICGNLERGIPKYTIVIPTFRRPEQLMEAVESAINQTFGSSRYEILIVENESDLYSLSGVKIKQLHAENLFYYQNAKNLGAGGNWNRGFELARTEWVCMLHDDDILYPHALESICATLEKVDQAKTAAISPAFDYAHQMDGEWVCDKPKATQHFWWKPLQNRLTRRSLLRLQLSLRDDPVAPTCGATFNRQIVVDMGGFPDQYKSDDMFFVYSLSICHYCYTTKEVWGQYRWGLNDSMNEATKAEWLRESIITDDYFLKFPQKGILPFIDRWFRRRLRFFICVKPCIEQVDIGFRDHFVTKYCPEWKDYKLRNIDKAMFRMRSIMANCYNLFITFLSQKGGNYVKNR